MLWLTACVPNDPGHPEDTAQPRGRPDPHGWSDTVVGGGPTGDTSLTLDTSLALDTSPVRDTAPTGTTPHDTGTSWPTEAAVAYPHTVFMGTLDKRVGKTFAAGRVLGAPRDQLVVSVATVPRFVDGLPGGRRLVGDHVHGALTDCGSIFTTYPVGDVDRDGYDDMWSSGGLILGPFEDEKQCPDDYQFWGMASDPVVGDVDVDKDGHPDVVMFHGGSGFSVLYGPFPEGLYTDDFPISSAWYGCSGDYGGAVIEGLAGPGSVVIGSGGEMGYLSCPSGTSVVYTDAAGPQGQRWYRDEDRLAWSDADFIAAVGDWDGDGHVDLVNSILYAGPIEGSLSGWTRMFGPGGGTAVEAVLDDIDGDGVGELLINDFLSWMPTQDYWVLLSRGIGRRDLTRDDLPELAVRLDLHPEDGTLWFCCMQPDTGDFDGDGLGDLVMSSGTALDGAGAIYVWRGADILAAAP